MHIVLFARVLSVNSGQIFNRRITKNKKKQHITGMLFIWVVFPMWISVSLFHIESVKRSSRSRSSTKKGSLKNIHGICVCVVCCSFLGSCELFSSCRLSFGDFAFVSFITWCYKFRTMAKRKRMNVEYVVSKFHSLRTLNQFQRKQKMCTTTASKNCRW